MRFFIITILYFNCCPPVFAQTKMDKTLKKFNKESVPYIKVDALNGMNQVVLLDTKGNETEKVHAFSKHWGKLLKKGGKGLRHGRRRPLVTSLGTTQRKGIQLSDPMPKTITHQNRTIRADFCAITIKIHHGYY